MLGYRRLEGKEEYKIGWIAALAIERAAATALLDERHDQPHGFIQSASDTNSYTWGCLSGHNVVIASLPAGGYGLTNATKVAIGLVSSFPYIRIGLLVGIGAGNPECDLDIRLGDVAVSYPQGTSNGVIQYDTGKNTSNGWVRTGALVPPPQILLNALSKLQAEQELEDSRMPSFLRKAAVCNKKFADNYMHPGAEHDHLFHDQNDSDAPVEIERPARANLNPVIHYGTIASGNRLIKNAEERREIIDSIGWSCICLEMEAAGLMNSFPCLVIRGICDYADSHKNDHWQRYASATAAAFAKELLLYVPKSDIDEAKKVTQVLNQVQSTLEKVAEGMLHSELRLHTERLNNFIKALHLHSYTERKDRNPSRVQGTCVWFTQHKLFTQWLQGDVDTSHILWVSADPGCGKSVLAKALVDEILPSKGRKICFFFFKDDFSDQRTVSGAGCALLHQILLSSSPDVQDTVFEKYDKFSNFANTPKLLFQVFRESCEGGSDEVVCVIDALDECQAADRSALIREICMIRCTHPRGNKIKIMVLSRPYFSIQDDFDRARTEVPILHLSGENDEEREMISQEINMVIEYRVKEFCARRSLTQADQDFLIESLISVPQRTYLWVHLTLAIIEQTAGFTRAGVRQACKELPTTVDIAYEKILNRTIDKIKTRTVLNMIVAAERPLTVNDICLLLALDGTQTHYHEVQDFLDSEERFRVVLRNICGLFVIIVDSCVYLLHQTAREFLVFSTPGNTTAVGQIQDAEISVIWKHSISVQNYSRTMAERCLWVIQLDGIDQRYSGILQYCELFWPTHLQSSNILYSSPFLDPFLKLCDPASTNFGDWFRRYFDAHWTLTEKIAMVFDELVDLLKPELCTFPLHIAAVLGITSLVRRSVLVKRSQKPSKKAISKALWLAVASKTVDTVRFLLEQKAQPNVLASGQAARSRVVIRNASLILNEAKARLLARINSRPFNQYEHDLRSSATIFIAIRHGDTDLLSLLLQNGASLDVVGKNERNALHEALFPYTTRPKVNLGVLQLLIAHGADRKARDIFGETPLMHFMSASRLHISPHICNSIRNLLWTGMQKDLMKTSYNGDTVLHFLAQGERPICLSCTTFLLKHGVSMEARGKDGETPLFVAVKHNHDAMVKELLRAGANVNTVRDDTWTPILAVMGRARDDVALIKILLDHGADVHAKDKSGFSCIHFVRRSAEVDLLIDSNANINAVTNQGTTPLMEACRRGVPDDSLLGLVKTMLEYGADHSSKDHEGKTALSYAKALSRGQPMNSYYKACVEFLQEAGAIDPFETS